MDFLSLMVGSAGRGGPVEAALLIGLFWAALSQPGRIRSVAEFRIATVLLAASIVVPVVVQMFMLSNVVANPQMTRFPATTSQPSQTALYATVIAPLLLMLAVIVGVDSVTPSSRGKADRSIEQ